MLTPHQGFTFNKFDKPNDWPELESTFDYKIEDGKLLGANDNIALSGINRQYVVSNGVVTKNTVPVPEGLVIGNYTTPSNGMFDITTQTFEPFEYYPIIKTDSNMLQVESKQNIGKVNYTVVGSPTIVNGILSDITNDNYVYVSRLPLTSWSGIELVIATPTTFSTTLTTSTIFGKKDDFYIYANSSGAITLSFVNAGGNYGLHPGNTEYYNRVKKIKLVFGANTTHRYYTIDGTTWIDAGEIAAIPNFNTYANFTFGSGSYSNAYTGSIDLNNTYIKVNDQVWFGKQKPEAKLVGPVDYTIVGSPTIDNGVVSGFSVNDYLTLPQIDLSGPFEMLFKFTTPSTWGSAYDVIFTCAGFSFQKQGAKRMLGYYLRDVRTSTLIQINGSHTSLLENTTYYTKAVYNGETITVYISTDGINWEQDMTTSYSEVLQSSACVFGRNRTLEQQAWGGSIDLNNTYIKLNNTLWFGKEDWTPCIFDDNSIVEFTGHKADYSSYNTYAFKPTIENSGTYDVWIDNQKVYENVTSATQTDINWSNLALMTGYSVTTPEALKAHVLKITPSNKSNKFTTFRHAVSSYTSSGTETTGVLQIHFELDYELELQYLTTQQTSPTTQSRLLYAVTSKTNELITPSLSNSFASTQVRRIPKIKSSDGFTNISRAFAFIQNSLKYANIDSGLLQYYTFSQSNVLEKLDGIYEVGSNAAAVLQQVPALKQLPNITSITTVDLTNFVTRASSLRPTDVDLSNKDDLTKLDIYGTSSYRIDGLKSLKVSNEAPFNGTSPQINVSYTGLERPALVELFNSLPYNVGYTVVGSPTITDGVVSGFSDSDYLRVNYSQAQCSSFEKKIKFTTGTIGVFQCILGSMQNEKYDGLFIRFDGKLNCTLSKVGGGSQDNVIDYVLSENTTYIVYLQLASNQLTVTIKDSSDTQLHSQTFTFSVDNGALNNVSFGRRFTSSSSFAGSIDIKSTYININGIPWFRGTAAMTKTIDVTDCTGISSLTNDDILIATNKGWTVTGAS